MAGRCYKTDAELGHKPVVVVDLDGTIAEYDKWRGEDHFGEPKRYARDALLEFKEWGWNIVVFTTRNAEDKIIEYLKLHGIPWHAINRTIFNPAGTSMKPIGTVYIDDRSWNTVEGRFSWLRVMRRLRRLYQPPLDTFIDDAAAWSGLMTRMMEWCGRWKNGRSGIQADCRTA